MADTAATKRRRGSSGAPGGRGKRARTSDRNRYVDTVAEDAGDGSDDEVPRDLAEEHGIDAAEEARLARRAEEEVSRRFAVRLVPTSWARAVRPCLWDTLSTFVFLLLLLHWAHVSS